MTVAYQLDIWFDHWFLSWFSLWYQYFQIEIFATAKVNKWIVLGEHQQKQPQMHTWNKHWRKDRVNVPRLGVYDMQRDVAKNSSFSVSLWVCVFFGRAQTALILCNILSLFFAYDEYINRIQNYKCIHTLRVGCVQCAFILIRIPQSQCNIPINIDDVVSPTIKKKERKKERKGKTQVVNLCL